MSFSTPFTSISRSVRSELVALVAGLGLLAAGATVAEKATDEAGEPVPGFGEIVDVRVVNVEVVVTDGKDRVSDLRPDDFRLLVDGRETPIEYFTEVRGHRAVDDGSASAVPTVPALEPGETVGTRYLVFIDDEFGVPTYRNRTLRELSDQVPLLGPDDRMAIVAFNGRQVEMLSSWTRSSADLEAVLEAAQDRPAWGLHRRYDLRNAVFMGSRYGNPFYDDDLRGRSFPVRGQQIYHKVERVVDAATSALRAFARPPGRKVMLLLSGGWPITDAYGVTGSRWTADREIFRPLVDTANRLGYTLYPVDLNGLPANEMGGAEFGTLEEATLASETARNRDWVEEDALVHLAGQTGGRAFLDGARLSALEDAIEDVSSYYWLGFSPTWREDDRRHDVKVEIRRKGLKARSRTSFSDLSRRTEATMMVESAQLFDLPLPGAGGLAVELGEPAKDGAWRVLVPVQVTIPLDDITVLPAGAGYVTQLELRIAATDDRGDRAAIPVIPIELRGDAPPEEGEVSTYTTTLKLRRRPHRLLISVVDRASGEMLSKRFELDV